MLQDMGVEVDALIGADVPFHGGHEFRMGLQYEFVAKSQS